MPDKTDHPQTPDLGRRRLLTTTATVLGGAGVLAMAVPFVSMMAPSARTRNIGRPVLADIGNLRPGERLTVEWRGTPVWALRRSPEMIEALQQLDEQLRDPSSKQEQQPDYARNTHRSLQPEYLIVVGLCTHLGCAPSYLPPGEPHPLGIEGWQGGFFCPCHRSSFDLAGRVFKGVPAPYNLRVPAYRFIDERHVLIGEDATG